MDPFATARKTMRGAPDEARARDIALAALAFIAADEDRTGPFLAQSGTDPAQIRSLAGDSGFLAGVLDFVLSEDALLLDFCAGADAAPETVHAARHILSPWTDSP